MDDKLEKKDIKIKGRGSAKQQNPGDNIIPKNEPSIKDLRKKGLIRDKKPVIIIEMDGQEFKFSKGGRVGLKGGGICKKGMNKKAFGKNS